MASLLAAALLLAAPGAAAQSAPQAAEWPPEGTTDPLLPVGIVTTSVAGTLASLGGFFLATGGDEPLATTLLLAGGATGVVGLPMLLLGASPVTQERESEEQVLGGSILLGVGATAIGTGAGFAQENGPVIGAGLIVGGITAAALGGVLISGGSKPRLGPDRRVGRPAPRPVWRATSASPPPGGWSAPPAPPPGGWVAPPAPPAGRWFAPSEPSSRMVPRSEGRVIAGQALTWIGVGAIAGGGLGTAAGWEDSEGWIIIITGPIMGTGVLLTAIGIPLWVTGAKEVPADSTASSPAPTWEPDVTVGPAAMSARWQF